MSPGDRVRFALSPWQLASGWRRDLLYVGVVVARRARKLALVRWPDDPWRGLVSYEEWVNVERLEVVA